MLAKQKGRVEYYSCGGGDRPRGHSGGEDGEGADEGGEAGDVPLDGGPGLVPDQRDPQLVLGPGGPYGVPGGPSQGLPRTPLPAAEVVAVSVK